jgi:hypothetical protein
MYSVLAMTTFPQISILTGLFLMVTNPCIIVGGNCPEYKLFNTPMALILTYLTFTLPFTVWVLTSFFKAMPAELASGLRRWRNPVSDFLYDLVASLCAGPGYHRLIGVYRRLE